jgi:hypothetical protein
MWKLIKSKSTSRHTKEGAHLDEKQEDESEDEVGWVSGTSGGAGGGGTDGARARENQAAAFNSR